MARLRDICRCGLNPLLDYFHTGSDALQAVVGPLLTEPEHRLLEHAWHQLAQHEVEALCGVCCRCVAPAASAPVVEHMPASAPAPVLSAVGH